ncbi:hypothetical protein ACQ859_17015 [Roseateles chitinivorans]|uniref:hypothetical protein n=1 Tax=Roseateles chitinivorans TaxID=2917965 RepID=UPI003D67FADC
MIRRLLRALWLCSVWLFVGAAAMAQENPLGRWDLRVEDDRQRVIVESTVRLTAYKGDGCRSGDWRKVEVEWSRRPNAGSFPIDEPLTWMLDQGQLIIGRNGVCDGYLQLVGPWKNGEPMAGDYISLGMGARRRWAGSH